MRHAAAGLLVVCGVAVLPHAASAIACERAATPVERAVCASPDLRRADGAMGEAYLQVLGATAGEVKAGFVSQQQAWLRSRDAACPRAERACLAKAYGDRQAQLDALLARVGYGEGNLLRDTTPLLLAGAWRAGEPRVLPGQPSRPAADVASAARDEGLPTPGTTVTGQPGKLCYGDDCFEAGLQALPLSAFYSGQRAAWLGLPAASPAYALMLTAEHVIKLVGGADGKLTALFDACAPLHRDCAVAAQDWMPGDPGTAVVDMTTGRPEGPATR